MTVSIVTKRTDYTADGLTSTYSVTFPFRVDTHIKVVIRLISTGVETTLAKGTDYTVAGAGGASGGSITLVNAGQAWLSAGALASGYKISILRNNPYTQATDVANADRLKLDEIENAFDLELMLVQQLQEQLDRCLKLPSTEDGTTFTVTTAAAAQRANQFLVFDGSGNLTLFPFASGSFTGSAVLFASTAGFATQDYPNFTWDSTLHKLKVPGTELGGFAANPVGPYASGTDTARIGTGIPFGNPTGTIVATPSAGGLTGNYSYAYIEWDVSGNHTGLSPITSVVAAANQYTLTIPQQRAGVIAKSLVRTKAGGSTYYLLHNFASGYHVHQTGWVDNVADGALVDAVTNVDGTKFYQYVSNNQSAYGNIFFCTHPNNINPGVWGNDVTVMTGAPGTANGLAMDIYGGILVKTASPGIYALATRVTGSANGGQIFCDYLGLTDDGSGPIPVFTMDAIGKVSHLPVSSVAAANPTWWQMNGGVAGTYAVWRQDTSHSQMGILTAAAGEPYFVSNVTYTGGDRYYVNTIPPWRMGNPTASATAAFNLDVAAIGAAGGVITWTNALQFDTTGNCTLSAGQLTLGSSSDVILVRDAAATLGIRNGTNAQRQYIYGTFTNSGNYERLELITQAASTALVRTNFAGTGAARGLQLSAIGAATVSISTNGVAGWIQSSSQHWITNADNSFDIGQSGANRPRTGYYATALAIGTNPAAAGDLRLAYAGVINTRNSTNAADYTLIEGCTINSVVNLVRLGNSSAGCQFQSRSGGAPPSTSDLPAGFWTVWRDTGGATTKVYYNNAGAIIASAAFA